jgi:hypothetical protein
MATNGQGSKVGRTIALDPQKDQELTRIAKRKKTSVSELLRPLVDLIIKANNEPRNEITNDR